VKAASEFRQAERLQPNVDPMFLMLVGVCTNFADRVETRAEVFGSMKGQRYLSPIGDKIFIIHGHDEAKWRELEKLLFNEFNLQTIVLKEERGAGETLIEKFEKFADACCYAFVMLTPDDFIKKGGKSYFQPRPNVLFELGWFYGRFGRDRVCMLKRADTEIPSDLAGILSIDFRDNVDEGFRKIRTELQKLGIIATQRLTRRSTGRAKKRPPVT
jgi:predicted nucleotide-binding protein